MASGTDHLGPLASRLNTLFETVRKSDGSAYSLREVADAVTAAGQPISHAYIGQLRTGQKVDPNLSHLKALAGFFQVPVEYFTCDALAAAVDSELILTAALQQVQARTDALRASVIPQAEAALQVISELLGTVRDLERGRALPGRPA